MQRARFHRHPDSTLWPPADPGLAALCACLDAGGAPDLRQDGTVGCRQTGTPLVFVETSGSTGAAKVIRRSQASWIASFAVNARAFGIGPGDTCATLGALGHSLTLYATIEALHLGAGLSALAGLTPRHQAQALAHATVLYATPSQLRLLRAGEGAASLPGIRCVLVGGGALDAGLRAGLAGLFPAAAIHEFFGASETSFVTLTDAETPPGSVGRAYPGVRIEIREGTTPLPPGQPGEIWVASPYLFEGYETGNSPDTRREGAFLGIGEVGVLDPAGHLTLLGRTSRRVRVAEHSVFPEEIERVLATDPGVTLCAAIPQPDPLRGAQIVAVIQGHAPEDRLRALCRAQLPPHAVPRRFVYLPRMPMLPAGKPDLTALAALIGAAP